MFCGNNSPHQTNYSKVFHVIDETKGNRSQNMNEIISYSLWESIFKSRFYHQDYRIFKLLSQYTTSGIYNSSSFISPHIDQYLRYPHD